MSIKPGAFQTASLAASSTEVPAASSTDALAHFDARLSFETDCDDIATALARDASSFEALDSLPQGLVVVYCWGRACNGAVKAARSTAELGTPVKEMLGGYEYWVREGEPIEGASASLHTMSIDEKGLVKLPGAISCLC